MESTIKPTAKEIKKAIDTIVRCVCFSPYPSPEQTADYAAALEFINSLPPDSARAAMDQADALIGNYYSTNEDED
jgi:hypothetical protein